MGSHQLCLKWKDHQTNMLTGFEELLTNEALVDVTLACEGESLRVHKVILSAFSPFFQKLLLENPCQHPIVILNGIKYTELRTIVDFMYRGEVNVNQDQLAALLHTAESLKVKGLTVEAGQRGKEISCLRQSSGTENMVPVLASAEKKGFTKTVRKRHNRSRHKIHTASSSGSESEDQASSNVDVSSVELAYATPDATTESNTAYPTIVSSHSQVDFISHSLFNTDIEESNEFSSSHNFKSPMNSLIPNNESSNCGADPKEEDSSQHLGGLQNSSPLLSQLLIQTHNLTTAHSSTSRLDHSNKEKHLSHNMVATNNSPRNEQLSPPLENQHTENNDIERLPHRSLYLSGRKVAFEGSSLQPRCPYCRKIYSRLSNLKRHMEIHMLDRKTYKCYICQKRFSWKTTLSSHLRRDHYVKVRSWAHQE